MNKQLLWPLLGALCLSVCLNVYLYLEKRRFEAAWLEQFTTTSEIEELWKLSVSATEPLTYVRVKAMALQRFGTAGVEEVEVSAPYTDFGTDTRALKVSKTLLLFKDGKFTGSKADLP